jgi:hypothetical protein
LEGFGSALVVSGTFRQEGPFMATTPPSTALAVDEIRPKLDFDNKTACAYLGVSPKVLARLRDLEEIHAAKIGGFWRYKQEWLDAYIDSVTIGRGD